MPATPSRNKSKKLKSKSRRPKSLPLSRSSKSSKSSKTSKASKSRATSSVTTLPAALDKHAKLFHLKLDKRGHEILTAFLTTCTSKLLSLLSVLAGNCGKVTIDAKDVTTLKKLFLAVSPSAVAPFHTSNKKKHVGGAETTLPSEYFGADAHASYSPSHLGGHPSGTSTESLIRPELLATFPQQQGGGPMNFDAEFSSYSTIPPGTASTIYSATGGAPATPVLGHLSKRIFSQLLDSVPHRPPMTEEGESAIRFVVECNLVHILTRVKAERRKVAVTRGKPVTAGVLHQALRDGTFVLPV